MYPLLNDEKTRTFCSVFSKFLTKTIGVLTSEYYSRREVGYIRSPVLGYPLFPKTI